MRPVRWGSLLFLLALSAAPGRSQVGVIAKLDQPDYLVGEPILVAVQVTNIGTEPLGYAGGNGRVGLTVVGGQHRPTVNLWGCYRGVGYGSGGGIFDPPLLAPGRAATDRYLLTGYRLEKGVYLLRATGKAGATWYFGWGRNSSSVSDRKVGDPVEGASFDVSLSLKVRDGTEDELRQRYDRYVREAAQVGTGDWWALARQAIAEMAQPFLEKRILGFADQPETAYLAVQGLTQIATPASRADLIGLYDKSADLKLRGSIVQSLAGIATPQVLPFFASLLAGRSTTLEDEIRVSAVLGIGRIGGEDAVKVLESAPSSPNPSVRQALVVALGNTRSAGAIPTLIGMYADEPVREDVCGGLATLTHYRWCDGSGTVAETQARWRRWWGSHAGKVTLYGMDQCAQPGALLPLVD
jgi:hypothetical protein